MLGKVFSYFNKKPWFLNIEHVLIALSDLFLPRFCLVCGRILCAAEKHLCIYCFSDLPLTRYSLLRRNPMADRFNALLQEKSGIFHTYVYATSLFFYNSDSGYKFIPQALKYHYSLSSGRFFAKILGKELAASPLFEDVDIVIPVPLHPLRKWKRGYNQAEIIAKEVASALDAALLTKILKRKRKTRSQTRLSANDKYKNVCGAFSVDLKRLAYVLTVKKKDKEGGIFSRKERCGRHILLVDDVFTTGATLLSSYFALSSALENLPEHLSSCRVSIATLCFVNES